MEQVKWNRRVKKAHHKEKSFVSAHHLWNRTKTVEVHQLHLAYHLLYEYDVYIYTYVQCTYYTMFCEYCTLL